MKDKWKTGVNSCGPRHPEWDASPETEAKSCGPGMQPFERSKNPIQVNLFVEIYMVTMENHPSINGPFSMVMLNNQRVALDPLLVALN